MKHDPRERIRVLFLSSPLTIGADTWIHLLLLRHLSRAHLALHAAGQAPQPGEATSQAFDALRAIPDVTQTSAHFGPSLSGSLPQGRLRSAVSVAHAATSLLGLAKYVREQRIEVLHSTDRPRDAIACAVLAWLTGAKCVIHIHVKYGDWMSRGVKWAFGRADALVGVSSFVAKSLRDAGYRAEKVHAVLNAIEPERWDPALAGGPVRSSLGIASEVPLIVSVSRLFHWKGHDILIRALAVVKREFPDVRLVIVGADYPEGSGTTQKLEALARSLGVSEAVQFTGERRDVASLLAASDIFALPSIEEPFGLVFAEAMAMKRPVVALTDGGTPEVVEHGKTGLLSDPGDVAGLAANLATLIREPELRARLGENGRRRVETLFVPERMANDVGAIYAQLVR